MFRNRGNRAENFWRKILPAVNKRPHELDPRITVDTKGGFGCAEIAFQHDCGSVVERMGEHSRRMNPSQSVVVQRQRREEWGTSAKRMDRGSEVVAETRQGQFHSACGAAGGGLCFKHVNVQPCLREDYCRCQSVWTRSDHARARARHTHLNSRGSLVCDSADSVAKKNENHRGHRGTQSSVPGKICCPVLSAIEALESDLKNPCVITAKNP